MAAYGFITSEEKRAPIVTLIVDKAGVIGKALAATLYEGGTTVFVSSQEPESNEHIHVPYAKTIPEIPEGDYSHIFFVWDGKKETLHLLEPLLQKAALDNACFVFVADYHCYSEKLGRFIHQEYAKATILLAGDVFGNDQYESTVTSFLQDAQRNGVLYLENVGLRHVYPVFFDDMIAQVLRVGFGQKQGSIFLAFQRHGMTELSVAHLLQKVNPLLKVDFKKEERLPVFLPEGVYLFDTSYDVSRKLQDTYTDFLARHKGKDPSFHEAFFFSPVAVEKGKRGARKRQKYVIGFFLLLVCLIFSPVLFTLLYAGLGASFAALAFSTVQAGKFTQALSFATTGEQLFSLSQATFPFAQQELQVVLFSSAGKVLGQGIQEGETATALLRDVSLAGGNFSSVWQGRAAHPETTFLSGIQAVKSALVTIDSMPQDMSLDGLSVKTLAHSLQPFGNVLDSALALFGFPQKKTYLVLFQNNMELRPGGGFIGSYALISVEKGKVGSITVHDVYDADGQLRGHVEPPFVIRRYIPQQHWYLRDSNFDVDFTKDTANAAFFLSQETGEKVDGVIGVDLTFVKALLAMAGPVYVPAYHETVTADNLFLLTEAHAEKHTFAGSTQKKDFLGALVSAIEQKMQGGQRVSLRGLLQLVQTVKQKDVLFGFSDPLIQDVFTANGLSSSLWDGRKAAAHTINDFTGLNEANIGVNKANYFLTRSVIQDMSVSPTGSISGTLTISYTNSSTPGQWPGGDYKNYLRVLLPLGAVLTGVTIDHKTQTLVPAVTDFHVYEKEGFTPPNGLEVASQEEEGKQLYGFLVTVPAQKTVTLSVGYSLAQTVDMTAQATTYSEWLFKQPGVDGYPYAFSLTVPSSLAIVQASPLLKAADSSVSMQTNLSEDTQFSLQLAKK